MTRLVVTLVLSMALPAFAAAPAVRTMRVPEGGIQPQVVAQGEVVHLIYFIGDAKAGDVTYARSTDGGKTFGPSIRVNSEPGAAIAVGTIRGPHLAVGRGGRAHVAWMGSGRATPKAPGNETPMLYARLNDAGDAFEPQRNVIAEHPGLDGGGSVAADDAGNVYVAWHAPGKRANHEEQGRCVWVARSSDDGKTFAPERRANPDDTGVCACCGLRAFADASGVHVLYRTACQRVHRDMHLLTSTDGERWSAAGVDRLELGTCIMSSGAMTRAGDRFFATWEGHGDVFFKQIGGAGEVGPRVALTSAGNNRKHPVLAVNAKGEVLFAWTEGTAFNRGGSVAYQTFDKKLEPIRGAAGAAKGLPAWGTVAAFARPDGSFVVIY